VIALRCSNRAALDLAARIDLRCADLWQQLDTVQAEISDLLAIAPDAQPQPLNRAAYSRLADRERQILRELEDWS
jgi:hypothetical protein